MGLRDFLDFLFFILRQSFQFAFISFVSCSVYSFLWLYFALTLFNHQISFCVSYRFTNLPYLSLRFVRLKKRKWEFPLLFFFFLLFLALFCCLSAKLENEFLHGSSSFVCVWKFGNFWWDWFQKLTSGDG